MSSTTRVFSRSKIQQRRNCLINRTGRHLDRTRSRGESPQTLDTENSPTLCNQSHQRRFITEVLEQTPLRKACQFEQLVRVPMTHKREYWPKHRSSAHSARKGGMLGRKGAGSRRRPGHRSDSHSLLVRTLPLQAEETQLTLLRPRANATGPSTLHPTKPRDNVDCTGSSRATEADQASTPLPATPRTPPHMDRGYRLQ